MTDKPLTTIFDAEGNKYQATTLNARELLAVGFLAKSPFHVDAPAEEAKAPEPKAEDDVVAPATKAEVAAPVAEEAPVADFFADKTKTLKDSAMQIAGYDDVERFLDTFKTDALREILSARFGETDARISKRPAIAKILELEANDQTSGD